MAPRIGMSSGQQYDPPDVNGDIKCEEKVSPPASVVGLVEDTEDGAGMIPFRTSKRLQGVMYRMIQKQSESALKNSSTSTKVKQSATTPSKGSLKRQHSPAKLIDLNEAIPEDCKEETWNSNESSRSSSKKKSRQDGSMVHFADPICHVIVKKETAETLESINQLPVSKNVDRSLKSAHQKTKAGVKATKNPGKKDQPKQRPMSCFDLLCNHVGRKGWRCYRATVEDESFCSYHLTEAAPAASFDTGMSPTVCT